MEESGRSRWGESTSRLLFGPQRWLMRRRRGVLLLIVAIALLALVDRIYPLRSKPAGRSAGDVARYHDKTFRVTRVVDGDTLRIAAPDGDKPYTVVRLWGVDTPEVYGRAEPAYFGPEASAFVRSLAAGQQVRLELWSERTRGYYGRLLAYVYLPDGTMLNERIVEAGYGYADWRFDHPYMDRFLATERRARKAKAGLWKNVTPDKMPKWRRRRMSGREGRIGRLPEDLLRWALPRRESFPCPIWT